MTEHDFESRLDDVLQTALDAPVDNLNASEPDVAELVQVAQHLQILAPAPAPQLANSRRRFLNEAARRLEQRGGFSNWLGRAVHRPAWAFAMVLVVIVFAASAMMVFSQSAPALQITSTQTMAATFTATPTKISLAPYSMIANESHLSMNSRQLVHMPEPQPVPVPVIPAIKLTAFND
jgi:hypothetical protein